MARRRKKQQQQAQQPKYDPRTALGRYIQNSSEFSYIPTKGNAVNQAQRYKQRQDRIQQIRDRMQKERQAEFKDAMDTYANRKIRQYGTEALDKKLGIGQGLRDKDAAYNSTMQKAWRGEKSGPYAGLEQFRTNIKDYYQKKIDRQEEARQQAQQQAEKGIRQNIFNRTHTLPTQNGLPARSTGRTVKTGAEIAAEKTAESAGVNRKMGKSPYASQEKLAEMARAAAEAQQEEQEEKTNTALKQQQKKFADALDRYRFAGQNQLPAENLFGGSGGRTGSTPYQQAQGQGNRMILDPEEALRNYDRKIQEYTGMLTGAQDRGKAAMDQYMFARQHELPTEGIDRAAGVNREQQRTRQNIAGSPYMQAQRQGNKMILDPDAAISNYERRAAKAQAEPEKQEEKKPYQNYSVAEYNAHRAEIEAAAKQGKYNTGEDITLMDDESLALMKQNMNRLADDARAEGDAAIESYGQASEELTAAEDLFDYLDKRASGKPVDYYIGNLREEYDAALYDAVYGKGVYDRRVDSLTTDSGAEQLERELDRLWEKYNDGELDVELDLDEDTLAEMAARDEGAEDRRTQMMDDAEYYLRNEFDSKPEYIFGEDREEQRRLLYSDLTHESYKDTVWNMRSDEKEELDRLLDNIIDTKNKNATTGFNPKREANEIYDAKSREAKAYDHKAQEIEQEQRYREKMAEFAQKAGEIDLGTYGGKDPTQYDASLIPEVKEIYDEMMDRYQLYAPQGTETEKAYFWMNNPYIMGGAENTLEYANKYMFANEEQVRQFNKFFAYDKQNGTDLASQYLAGLDSYLTTRLSEYQDAFARKVASDPVRGTIARVMSYPMQAISGLIGMAGTAAGLAGEKSGKDRTSGWYQGSRFVQNVREEQNAQLGNWAEETLGPGWGDRTKFVAGMLDSIGDNIVAIGAGSALSGGKQETAMKLVQLIMSGSATSNKMIENLDAGKDPTEAALGAVADGVIEWLTERVSLENLLNPDVKDMLGDGKRLASYFAKNFTAEASEEMASDLLNTGVDAVLSAAFGHENELQQKYDKYVRQGMGDREATRAVLSDLMQQVGLSGLAGGLSGLMLSGGRWAMNKASQAQAGRNAQLNQGMQRLVDVGMGMKNESLSHELAMRINEDLQQGRKPGKAQLGKLAQLMVQETGEEQGIVIRDTVRQNIMKELTDIGAQNAQEAADIITDQLIEGGTMSRADMRALAQDEKAIQVWKDYNSFSETRLGLEKAVEESTKAQRSVMEQVSEITSGETKATGALAREINEAVRGTRTQAEAIDRLQQQMPNIISEEYAQTAKEILEADKAAKQSRTYVDDVMKIRLAAMTLNKDVPNTRLDTETAQKLYDAARDEFMQADRDRVVNQVKVVPGQGTVTYDGAEYGTDAWNEKLKGLTKQQRNQMGALGEIVTRMGNKLNLINDPENPGVYGFEQSDGTITINVAGMNRNGLQHHMLVTMSHELTHWLEQNSAEGYDALRQFAVDSLRDSGVNVEQLIIDTINNQNAVLGAESGSALDLHGAMAEVVAKSCENLLGSEAFRNRMAEENPSLYNNIKTFVKDFVARIRAAVGGMTGSLSREARVLLNRTEKIAELWLGARDEALGREAGTGAEAQEKISYSTADFSQSDEKGIKKGSLTSAAGRQVSASTSETTAESTSIDILSQEEDSVKRAREQELDNEYLQAIRDGDIKKQLRMIWKKINNTEGIYPFYAPERYAGEHIKITQAIKEGDLKAIKKAAEAMAKYVPDNAVLIPMPGHTGVADENGGTMLLTKELSKMTGAPVINALEGNSRESRYASKKHNKRGITADQMGLRKIQELPTGYIPMIVDNVVSVGETAKAALDAIKGGVILSYTKGLAENVVPGLKAAYATKDKEGNNIPLSKKIDPDNPNWRWSVMQSPDMDVDNFMSGLQEWNLNSVQERTMLRQYKDLKGTVDTLRMKISDREAMLRKLEQKQAENGKLSAYDREEMRKINNWLSNDRNRLDRTEAELVKVTGDKGYARMMMQQESLMQNLVNGVTADQMIDLVEKMGKQLDEMNGEMQKRAARLKELGQKEAVLRIRQQFNRAGLSKIAAQLKEQMNSSLPQKDIENRLAMIALKMQQNEYDSDTTGELVDMILGKMRGGSDSYVLETLKGRNIMLSPAQLKELKATDGSLSALNAELAGTGIRFTTKGNTNLEQVWDQLSDEITSLDKGENPLNMVNRLMELIRSEKQTQFDERFSDENVQQTTEAVLNAAVQLIPEIISDPKGLRMIKDTLQFVSEMSGEAAAAADEMGNLDAVIQRLKQTGKEAAGKANKLTGDIQTAMNYFNELADQSEAALWRQERVKLIEQLKSENTMNLLKEQEKWKQKIEKDKNARQKMDDNLQLRKKITTNVSRVRKLLINETDIKNMPEHMKGLAREMLGKIVDNDLAGRKISGIMRKDLIETRRVLDAMKEMDGDFTMDDLRLISDEEAQAAVAEALADLEDGIGFYNNRMGGDMMANLQGLHNALDKISDAISTITGVINAERSVSFLERRIDVADAAEDVKKDFGKSRFKGDLAGRGSKAVNVAKQAIFYGNMTPVYYFKMLRNGGMDAVWKDLQQGENRSGLEFQKTKDFLGQLAEKTNYKSWADQRQDVVLGGSKRSLSIENMMELYAIWKREQTTNPEMSQHLAKGGVYIQDEDQGSGKLRREITQQRAVRVTDEEIKAMYDQMTAEQKEYLDKIVSYLSNEMSELGNEASMRMYGIKKYKEKWYFPMKVWDGVKSARSDKGITGTDENRAAHKSWSKRRQHMAQNALVIGNFTQDAVNHIVEMINYNTMAPAIENMNKILNFQFTEGETQDDFTKRNLRIMFEEAYGKEALRYLETFMKDLNGGVTQDQRKTLRDRAVSMFKKNAVAGSLSVAAQQPLSYIRAATMISPKYLAEALNLKYWKGSYAEMQKYSGVAVLKSMGRFDMNFGQSAKDYITPETGKNAYETISDLVTMGPEMADRMTWTRMWSAVKAETAAQNKGMDVTSEEFLRKVADRFNAVMRETQVYDSILVKSSNMRSQNLGMKLLTSFMAEPTLSLNVLADAVGSLRAGDAKAGAKAAKAAATFLLSAVMQAVVKGFMGAGRNPDDDRTALENFTNKVGYNLINEANPFSLIPGYSDVVELIKKGEMKDDAMGAIGKIITVKDTASKALSGKGRGAYRDIEDTVAQLAQLFTNIPAKNLMRDGRAMYNWITGSEFAQRENSVGVLKYQTLDNLFDSDTIFGAINTKMGEAGFVTSTGALGKRIYEAQKRGDEQAAKEMTDYYVLAKSKANDPQKVLQQKIASLAKADDDLTAEEKIDLVGENATSKSTSDYVIKELKKGTINKETAQAKLAEIYPEKSDDDIWWQVDRAAYAAETGADKVNGTYYRLTDAINSNKTAEIREAVKDLTTHGVTEKKVKEKLSDWKSDYMAADLAGKSKIRNAIEIAYKELGYTKDDADKMIEKWSKEKKK